MLSRSQLWGRGPAPPKSESCLTSRLRSGPKSTIFPLIYSLTALPQTACAPTLDSLALQTWLLIYYSIAVTVVLIAVLFGRPFVKLFTLCYRSVVCLSCLSCPVCLSVCDVRALWPNGWTDQDETWHAGRPRPWPHCVRWGLSSPSPKGAQSPQFSAHICCGQMAAWIKMSLGMEQGLGPGDFVLDGDPALPSQKGDGTPKFSAHVYCGQTVDHLSNC